jgi:hypothetical protein
MNEHPVYLFCRFLLICLTLTIAQPVNSATVITFDNFYNGNPTSFTSGTENGFTISATNASIWGSFYGFPSPSAGVSQSGNIVADFTFTNGSVFTFAGLDLVNPGFGGSAMAPVTVSGYLGASLIAQDTFNVPVAGGVPANFTSLNLAGLSFDTLVISVTSNDVQTPLVDNVIFNVPEPATWILLATGLFYFSNKRRMV